MLKYISLAVVLTVFSLSSDLFGQTKGIRKPLTQTKRFVNHRKDLNANLLSKFVEFSFNYPTTWMLESRSPQDNFFVALYRSTEDADFSYEYFSAGTFRHPCSKFPNKMLTDTMTELINSLADKLLPQLLTNIEKSPPEQIKLSNYDAVSLGFQGSETGSGKNLRVWGRFIAIPGVKKVGDYTNGVMLLVLASELSPEVKSLADIGIKGGAAVMINSFRFEPAAVGNVRNTVSPTLMKVEIGNGRAGLVGVSNLKSSFKKGEEILIHLVIGNVTKGTKIKSRWIAERVGRNPRKVIKEEESTVESDSFCGGIFVETKYGKYSPDLAGGKYLFEVYADGKLLKSIPYVLEK